jgi:hypothetical protein
VYCHEEDLFLIDLGIHWRMFANVRDGMTFLGIRPARCGGHRALAST